MCWTRWKSAYRLDDAAHDGVAVSQRSPHQPGHYAHCRSAAFRLANMARTSSSDMLGRGSSSRYADFHLVQHMGNGSDGSAHAFAAEVPHAADAEGFHRRQLAGIQDKAL